MRVCFCVHAYPLQLLVVYMCVHMLKNCSLEIYTTIYIAVLFLLFDTIIIIDTADLTHFPATLYPPGLSPACRLCARSSWHIHGLCPSSVPVVPAHNKDIFYNFFYLTETNQQLTELATTRTILDSRLRLINNKPHQQQPVTRTTF